MPHLLSECKEPAVILREATQTPPFGPGFTEEQVAGATNLKVVGSSFNDPGDDWVEFQLTKLDGTVQKKRVGGY